MKRRGSSGSWSKVWWSIPSSSASTTLSIFSAISNYSATLSSLILSFARNINGVSDPKLGIKKDSCEPERWGSSSWQIN